MEGMPMETNIFRMKSRPTTLANKDFVSIGGAITKYTNTMERGLEEQAIGIPVPGEDPTDSKLRAVDVLEAAPCIKIGSTDTLPLVYFHDGIQRTQFVGNVFSEPIKRLVPIMFTTVGAIVVHLDGEHVRQYLDPIIIERFITPEKSLLPKEIADSIPPDFLHELPGFVATTHPNEFRKRMFEDVVKRLRQDTEHKIIKAFEARNPDDWLVIDGPLRDIAPVEKRVGIVKRHVSYLLDGDLMFDVLKDFVANSGTRVRSCKFKVTYKTAHAKEILACYSKLLYNFKSGIVNNPEFSLIRVETAYKHAAEFDKILNMVLAMNSPMSKPSDSWDKKIYPIYQAELFLKANAKDDKLIRTAFGGFDFA